MTQTEHSELFNLMLVKEEKRQSVADAIDGYIAENATEIAEMTSINRDEIAAILSNKVGERLQIKLSGFTEGSVTADLATMSAREAIASVSSELLSKKPEASMPGEISAYDGYVPTPPEAEVTEQHEKRIASYLRRSRSLRNSLPKIKEKLAEAGYPEATIKIDDGNVVGNSPEEITDWLLAKSAVKPVAENVPSTVPHYFYAFLTPPHKVIEMILVAASVKIPSRESDKFRMFSSIANTCRHRVVKSANIIAYGKQWLRKNKASTTTSWRDVNQAWLTKFAPELLKDLTQERFIQVVGMTRQMFCMQKLHPESDPDLLKQAIADAIRKVSEKPAKEKKWHAGDVTADNLLEFAHSRGMTNADLIPENKLNTIKHKIQNGLRSLSVIRKLLEEEMITLVGGQLIGLRNKDRKRRRGKHSN